MIQQILSQMGYSQEPLAVTQFQNEEDGDFYQVWRVDYPQRSYVLKKAKGQELSVYQTYFSQPCGYAPQLYATANVDGTDWLLIEYVPGNNLMKCTRSDLVSTMDSLIAMQKAYWLADTPSGSFAKSLENRKNRAKFLHNPQLEAAYEAYLQEFVTVPRTLCHDDLLPFNVVISNGKAVFIDWEVGGILPYPTSIARLIAHADEDENAFFFMKNEDKYHAIDYYFEHFIKDRGVPYETYRRSLDLCLFYEYCEWVYVGHKYGDTDSERFREYSAKARNMASKLGF